MSKPPAKRRRLELSLDDKMKLIKDSETGPKLTHKQLGEKYGIGKSTVSDILKKKADYITSMENNTNGQKFRFVHSSKNDELNGLMWDWFRQARDKSIPLSGPILQQKSLEFAEKLGIPDFKASNGWLDKFKARHSIKAFKVSGESAGVDKETVDTYKARLPDICSGYDPSDIFNCDETGLYYRALPENTLAEKGSSTKGIKNSKERLTIMFACSATGEKLKPLVIGKASKPRCFKNVKVQRLPVTWKHNKKAWMNTVIFTDWIKGIDRQMQRENRKILMFLDNASSHAKDLNLKNVTLKYLPANTTSHLQPLDQGIIRAFKARYRRKLLKSLVAEIEKVDSVSELCKKINVLDSIYWIKQAWEETQAETIVKCFKLSGFSVRQSDDDATEESDDENDDDIPLAQLMRLSRQVSVNQDMLETFDNDVPTEDNSDDWEQNLIDSHVSKPTDKVDSDCDSDDDVEETVISVSTPGLTVSEIMEFSKRLKSYAVTKDDRFLDIAQELHSVSRDILVKSACNSKQATLDSFFVKS